MSEPYKTDREALRYAFYLNVTELEHQMKEVEREKEKAKIWAERKSKEERLFFLSRIFSLVIPIIRFLGKHYNDWCPEMHLLQGGFVNDEEYLPPKEIPHGLISNIEELQRITIEEAKSVFWTFFNTLFDRSCIEVFGVVNMIISMKEEPVTAVFESFFLAKLSYEVISSVENLESGVVNLQQESNP